MHAKIIARDPTARVLTIAFYSDATSYDIAGTNSGYPIHCVPCSIPWKILDHVVRKGLTAVAFLPILKAADGSTLERRRVLHACLDILLREFRLPNGIQVVNAAGETYNLYPVPLLWITDSPETADLACVKRNACAHCTLPNWAFNLIRRADAEAVAAQSQPRTSQSMRADADALLDLRSEVKEARVAADGRGATAVRSALNELAFSCDIFPNMFASDSLHGDDLGVWPRIVELADAKIRKAFPARGAGSAASIIDNINLLLSRVPKRANLHLAFCGGKYFPLTPHVTAQENRAAMQVFVFVLHGALPAGEVSDDIIALFVAYLDYYMCKCRRNAPAYHTEATLAQLKTLWEAFADRLLTFKALSPSELAMIKLHVPLHLAQFIRDFGTPSIFNSNSWEMAHRFLKRAFQAGNKKGGVEDTAFQYRQRLYTLTELGEGSSFRRFLESDSEEEDDDGKMDTAFSRAADALRHAETSYFMRRFKALDLATLAAGKSALPRHPTRAQRAACDMLRNLPHFALLPQLLDVLLRREVDSDSDLARFHAAGASRSLQVRAGALLEISVARLVLSGAVRSQPPHLLGLSTAESSSFVVQRLRPGCFAFIDSGSAAREFVCRVEAMFSIALPKLGGAGGMDLLNLLFVRWLDYDPALPASHRTTCQRVRWQPVGDAAASHPRMRGSDAYYSVIKADSVRSVPYIVPDFTSVIAPRRKRGRAGLQAAGTTPSEPSCHGFPSDAYGLFFVNRFMWTHS